MIKISLSFDKMEECGNPQNGNNQETEKNQKRGRREQERENICGGYLSVSLWLCG